MSELQHTLRGLHEELNQAQRLDPEDRAMLETLLPPNAAMPSRAQPSGSRPDTPAWQTRSGQSSTRSARPAFDCVRKALF